MTHYTIYEVVTGRIVQTGTHPDPLLWPSMVREGCDIIAVASDPRLHVVVGGAVMDRPVDEIEAEQMAEAWSALRRRRDDLLTASDWTELRGPSLAGHSAWQAYREALRDMPQNTTDPRNPEWPEAPT